MVLDAFKVSLFALYQPSILESYKFDKSYKLKIVAVLYYRQTKFKNIDALGRSLIRIRNKIGPNIDPCGTPQEISLSVAKSIVFKLE